MIRGDQSPSLPGLCSSQRTDPPISVIGFAPPNVVLTRDFFRVGLPADDWSACDSECTLSALRVTAWVRVGPNLLGQGIVLSANKTAPPSLRVFVPSSGRVGALNAYGLFARAAAESRRSPDGRPGLELPRRRGERPLHFDHGDRVLRGRIRDYHRSALVRLPVRGPRSEQTHRNEPNAPPTAPHPGKVPTHDRPIRTPSSVPASRESAPIGSVGDRPSPDQSRAGTFFVCSLPWLRFTFF